MRPSRSSSRVALLLAGAALVGCGGDDAPAGATCADPATAIAFPSPLWLTAGKLAAPAGDRGAAVIDERRPGWTEQLGALDGWSRLPDIVVPLSAVPTGASAEAVTAYVPEAAGWRAEPTAFEVSLLEGAAALRVRPLGPLGIGADEVIVALGDGAVAGAEPLAVCDADGAPHPDQLAAAAAVGSAGWALRLPLASTSYALPALGERLAEQPVLAVDTVEARTLESFGDKAPPPEVVALLSAPVAAGLLSLPDYRGDDGRFTIGADGLPEPAAITKPGFLVALPKGGEAPYPFVVFQHGGGQDKADFFALAEPLLAAGFAFVAIDLPEHGDRGTPESNDFDFINFDDGLATRDNFRQTTADHMAILTGIGALDAALADVLGAEQALDGDRAFYMGLSLGGITGSITFASAPALRAGALFVAGSSYADIATYGMFGVLFNDVKQAPPAEGAVVFAALQTLLDGADPAAYAVHVERRNERPRAGLFLQAVDDPIVIMSANDRLARAFGAQLAVPNDHPVEGMETVALPATDNFSWPLGGEAATRVLVQSPMAEIPKADRHGALIVQPYSQQMVAQCFAAVLAGGGCEVVDTGFAEH